MTPYVTEFKSSLNNANVTCQNNTLLCDAAKPILLMMKIFGVYFYEPGRVDLPYNGEERVSKRKPKIDYVKWYCVCLTVLSGLNVVRYIPSFWVGVDFVPNLTVSRIVMISWIIQCFLNRLLLLRACWLRSHLTEYFKIFDKVMMDTCCMNIKPCSNKSRKYSIFFVIVTWLIIVLNVGASIYHVITHADPGYLVTLCNPFPGKSVAVQIFFVVFHGIELGAWVSPVTFQVALYKILSDQFSSVSNVLCKMTKDEGRNVWQKMKDIRLKHLQLCKAMDILEQDTKYLIAGNYVTNIFLICFIVYQMVASNSAISVLGYITFSTWLVMNFSIMASVAITAAQVNEEVRYRN
ncbi:hypothetical protein KP79_PYT10101 [Mizuhopecten yessoensis]|uniref:Gustatory receptor n=1 Tax=Mizuhopecten yessoensis TaxID=6573 RepID=A0A210QE16_MIZYE|nr:hypothetical protein KP79_PYT10101 [Mizuhopecten yessoensis]